MQETKINSKSESIQLIYYCYTQDQYLVNRRYQRKLVWQETEKVAFVDSIINKYSVPLILLAERCSSEGRISYEIIDGMQRLNSIIAFIENEFPVNYQGKNCYFDISILAESKNKLDNGVIIQKQPCLPKEVCLSFASYPMPISYVSAGETVVEEIFRRINSYGRQLSPQEIRQAGALGKFPDLVRKIAENIRGDVSLSDILPLNKMNQISLSGKNLPYGINIFETFWVKNRIITQGNMRTSRDEEVIAWLLLYVIGDKKTNPSKHTLDVLYKHEVDDLILCPIEDKIEKLGEDTIINWILSIFNNIKAILSSSKKTFFDLLYPGDDKGRGLIRSFQVVFLSFFELIVNRNCHIFNIQDLSKALDGLGKRKLADLKTDEWDANYRNETIDSIVGVIEKFFVPNSGQDVTKENWISQLESLLQLSRIEGNLYDFKMGLYDLRPSAQFNEDLLVKCIKTLTAEVNAGPNTKGYVILGVADKQSDADSYEKRYRCKCRKGTDSHFNVCGIGSEVDEYYGGNIDNYIKKIKSVISNTPIETAYKSYILSKIRCVAYYDKDVIVLELQSKDSPVAFDDKFFTRESNDNHEIKGAAETTALMNRFRTQ